MLILYCNICCTGVPDADCQTNGNQKLSCQKPRGCRDPRFNVHNLLRQDGNPYPEPDDSGAHVVRRLHHGVGHKRGSDRWVFRRFATCRPVMSWLRQFLDLSVLNCFGSILAASSCRPLCKYSKLLLVAQRRRTTKIRRLGWRWHGLGCCATAPSSNKGKNHFPCSRGL